MRVLLAPDKFRGTFAAAEVCRHLARGIHAVAPGTVIESLPLADGGEGTLDVLLSAMGGTRHTLRVRGPLGDEITAEYGVTPEGIAVLESALFCGLDLVPSGLRDPMATTSYGLGQGIASLLDSGIGEFLIGLGGTATVDGGIGMVKALGFRFPAPCLIDDTLAHPGLATARFTILCDVDTPPLGPEGAAPVFGPQKGASPEEVLLLQDRLSALVEGCALWKGVPQGALACLPMGGAAGGLGLACKLFLGGRLVAGAGYVMDRLGFNTRLAAADLLITGEGSFDIQSRRGKAAQAAVESAASARRPTAVVAGRWDGTLPERCPGVFKVFAGGESPESAEKLDADCLAAIGADVMRWAAGSRNPQEGT